MTGPPEDRGCNMRALQELFRLSNERKGDITDKINVNVMEVYNEQIRDLLSDNVRSTVIFSRATPPLSPGRRQEARGPARRARRPRPFRPFFFLARDAARN